ncbi:hypothetical protein GOTRE_060_00540 [Gordonia terrae NBRC 100016]|uniref:Uncharacterized protein n=1 Tax=Gordonia terrae NBRC 100016 TaxID=1089454 RepID=A0ABQ0HE34_9ACTN|nr:hypothetical protein GOTRE_060_00540 [Gordonia terrae NBRC 100016]
MRRSGSVALDRPSELTWSEEAVVPDEDVSFTACHPTVVTRADDAAQFDADHSYTSRALSTSRIHNLRARGGVQTNCR